MTATALRRPEETRRRLADLVAPLANDLAEVERIFRSELASRSAHVQRLVDHSAQLRGKRLRPILMLLSAQACGGIRPQHHILAAVVEMVHTATLVHDDVLDDAELRRHSPTVNSASGNETAVLLGDYLFSHAFHLAASVDSTLACRWIGRAATLVCEGEMLQVHNRGNLNLDEADYFTMIRGKTAELTAVSSRLGAHYAGAPPEQIELMDQYGRDLGVAFQIADDVLDLLGQEATTGKTLGTDLRKQKLTLPVISFLSRSTAETADCWRKRILSADQSLRSDLMPLLETTGALDDAWEAAKTHAAAARKAAESLPESPAQATLKQLTVEIIHRAF